MSGAAALLDARGAPVPHQHGAFALFEGQAYRLQAPAGVTVARLDGLDLGPPRAGGHFDLALPFAVGHYTLSLHGDEINVEHAIVVQPAQHKADPATWMALLDELEAWLPGLVTGVEGARVGGVGAVGFASPLLVEALLPLLPALERALAAVLEAPRLRTVDLREERPLHQVRRADRAAVVALARAPEAAAALRGAAGRGRPPTLWAADTEQVLDHAANRHVAHLIHRVLARLRQAAAALRATPGTKLRDGGRWIASRAAACERGAARLERRWRASALAALRPEAASEGALLVVQDHPTYARLHRLAWRIVGARFSLTAAPERAATRPSFTLYELWSFLALQRVISEVLGPGWRLRARGLGALLRLEGSGGGACFAWRRGEDEARLDFNPTFPALHARAPDAPRWSLSKQRRPDLCLRRSGPGGRRWAAFDAKYRVGQKDVADAMQSVHIYRDALWWPAFGGKPSAGYLICPADPADAACYFDGALHAEHALGALCLRPGQGSPEPARRALSALLELP